jgi:hypothetical protein
MIHVLAILDTMWGNRDGLAPRVFKINSKNFSGRRLYSLVGEGNSLLVTNACRELVNASHKHGTPDTTWLSQNLNILQRYKAFDVILVCGKVAQVTFKQCKFTSRPYTRIIEIPHPAARTVWTKEYIETIRTQIRTSKK